MPGSFYSCSTGSGNQVPQRRLVHPNPPSINKSTRHLGIQSAPRISTDQFHPSQQHHPSILQSCCVLYTSCGATHSMKHPRIAYAHHPSTCQETANAAAVQLPSSDNNGAAALLRCQSLKGDAASQNSLQHPNQERSERRWHLPPPKPAESSKLTHDWTAVRKPPNKHPRTAVSNQTMKKYRSVRHPSIEQ
jgi:hypothetical protein